MYAVLLVGCALIAALLVAAKSPPASQKIEIACKRFSYEPGEIILRKGQTVTLVLHSHDAIHGFTIDRLGIKAEVSPFRPTEITFTPNVTGEFVAKCSHYCGLDHSTMSLNVRVTD
jgi:cytochrome c oxidase subunit 2